MGRSRVENGAFLNLIHARLQLKIQGHARKSGRERTHNTWSPGWSGPMGKSTGGKRMDETFAGVL